MTDLALAVLFGTIVGVVYKGATQAGCRRLPFLMVERIVIVAIMALYSLRGTGFDFSPTVALVSLIAGSSIFCSRWLLLKALTYGKVGLSWTILNLSVILPVLFSILIWNETPSIQQAFGLILTPLSIIFMRERAVGTIPETAAWKADAEAEKRRKRSWYKFIILCFLFEGTFGLCFKSVRELNLAESRNMFILLYNLSALGFLIPLVLKTKTIPDAKEGGAGVATGVCVSVSAIFFVRAILQLPGTVSFPVASASGILLMMVISRLIWKEKSSVWQKLGLLLAVTAIVLISV